MAPKKIKSPNDSGKAMAEKSLPAKYTAKDRMYIIKQAKARNSEAGEGRNSKSNGEIDVGVDEECSCRLSTLFPTIFIAFKRFGRHGQLILRV
jgi:hypothetical protein